MNYNGIKFEYKDNHGWILISKLAVIELRVKDFFWFV